MLYKGPKPRISSFITQHLYIHRGMKQGAGEAHMPGFIVWSATETKFLPLAEMIWSEHAWISNLWTKTGILIKCKWLQQRKPSYHLTWKQEICVGFIVNHAIKKHARVECGHNDSLACVKQKGIKYLPNVWQANTMELFNEHDFTLHLLPKLTTKRILKSTK